MKSSKNKLARAKRYREGHREEIAAYQIAYRKGHDSPCLYVMRLGGKKRYIGSTVHPERRRRQHLSDLRHNLCLQDRQDDFREFGEAAFEFKILLQGTEREMADLEQLLILALPPGELYNRYARKKGKQCTPK